jgi:proteasome accessory factor A
MEDRIYGIETEYGCLPPASDPFLSPDFVSIKAKDCVFYREGLGIVDMHYRGRDEPPGNGGFLFNGGRVYIDMGHVEYATPECTGLFDLVAADRAGERLVQRALDQLGLADSAAFFKNNIDHYTGATFGCHENYLVRREVPFSQVLLPTMLPFFVTRQIYAGAGRVGAYDEMIEFADFQDEFGDQQYYQISQRADHIVTEIYEWIQFSRAIINTRDEPLSDYTKYRRLHLLVGDSNMSEYAGALKVGTTALLLSAIEMFYERYGEKLPLPALELADPVYAIRHISRDNTFAWRIELKSGKTISAVDLQREYLYFVQSFITEHDAETEWVLSAWESILNDLEDDWQNVTTRVDWAAKKWLLETFIEEEKLDWDDPWIKSQDLEYHNIDVESGLYYALQEHGQMERVITDQHIEHAISNAPQDTRAKVRSFLMRTLTQNRMPCIVDWHQIYAGHTEYFEMKEPFDTNIAKAQRWIKRIQKRPTRS